MGLYSSRLEDRHPGSYPIRHIDMIDLRKLETSLTSIGRSGEIGILSRI